MADLDDMKGDLKKTWDCDKPAAPESSLSPGGYGLKDEKDPFPPSGYGKKPFPPSGYGDNNPDPARSQEYKLEDEPAVPHPTITI